MPSAVKQKLPADLWHHGRHQKHSHASPESVNYLQEIQASPGHSDVFQVNRQYKRQDNRRLVRKFSRREANSRGLASVKSASRSGSSDILNMRQSTHESDSGNDRKGIVELSSSAKSDSCLSCNPSDVHEAYALESPVPPDPSELPFPPLEWLQCSSKSSEFPLVSCFSLKAILSCQVAA